MLFLNMLQSLWHLTGAIQFIIVGLPFCETLGGNGVITPSWKQHIKCFLNALD